MAYLYQKPGIFYLLSIICHVSHSTSTLLSLVSFRRPAQVWKAPALITQFAPFALLRTYTGHHDDILSIEWTPDSQYAHIHISLGRLSFNILILCNRVCAEVSETLLSL